MTVDDLLIKSENSKVVKLKSAGINLGTEADAKNPLNLEWVFGYNSQVPLINCTTTNENPQLLFTAGHILLIFDCKGKNLFKFIGHEHEIFAVDSNATGRFIVTADRKSLINIWDREIETEFIFPIRSIVDPFPDKNLSVISLSYHGKYLMTACDGSPGIVKFWKWTFGKNNADDTFELPEKYGTIKSLKFCGNLNEMQYFVITAENGVIFGAWDEIENKMNIHYPTRSISIVKNYKETIFIEKSHKAISITDCGTAVVWNDMVSEVPINGKTTLPKGSFKKELIKSIKLCDYPINVIKSIDNCIVIGDDTGKIRFYDKELKILYWCPNYDLGSIVSISFNICATDEDSDRISEVLALDNSKFNIRNFFIGTSTGQIIYVDFLNKLFQKIWYKAEDKITAIDVHPSKNLLCVGNYSGRIALYDYDTKELTAENQINIQKERSPVSDTEIISLPLISVIAFSQCGNHLFCSLESGTLLYLENMTLTLLNKFKFSCGKIVQMKFSKDSAFFAYYDVDDMVVLLNFSENWSFVGKYRYHSQSICDILFISNPKSLPRLISLAKDRKIIEYDLLESLKDTKRLVIAFSKRIFQTAVPVAITLIMNQKKNEEEILIADNEFKFRIYDKNTFEILHIFLGPLYDDVVHLFDINTCSYNLSNYFAFATQKTICLYIKTSNCSTTIDANPFRSMGIVGHYKQIKEIRTVPKKSLLFSIGEDSTSVYMWKIDIESVQEQLSGAGEGLKPYCNLIPGGKYGNAFQDMQELFYYMQLLADNSILDEKKVLKKYFLDNLTGFIKLKIKGHLEASEVPDYLRGLGFFLTDYESACISNELLSEGKKNVNFEDIIKIYLNYSPINGIDQRDVICALKNILAFPESMSETEINESQVKISQLKHILTDTGEQTDAKDADNYLKELLGTTEKLSKLPDSVCFQELVDKLLFNF